MARGVSSDPYRLDPYRSLRPPVVPNKAPPPSSPAAGPARPLMGDASGPVRGGGSAPVTGDASGPVRGGGSAPVTGGDGPRPVTGDAHRPAGGNDLLRRAQASLRSVEELFASPPAVAVPDEPKQAQAVVIDGESSGEVSGARLESQRPAPRSPEEIAEWLEASVQSVEATLFDLRAVAQQDPEAAEALLDAHPVFAAALHRAILAHPG